ncbi:hypothetical protein QWZ08_17930 [Ferruginibacter paludis]|uniref:hypothetical protein n=1 Tax=Ferruginibacter paludis TaxID=1310417 RepID=UPI0025B2ECA0|nr:hypothetical protein [Ferruginibacter paludis]MDN3657536.1 hypothetical protein [Ferruginibacter paludis]
MQTTDQLFESIFKRNFRSVDTEAFLTALTKECPYFTVAQFYLLKQLPTNSRDFASQAAKTALLFNNPFWLNYQLTSDEQTTLQPEKASENKDVDIEATKNMVLGPVTEPGENSIEQAALEHTPIVGDSYKENTGNETAVENPGLPTDNLYAKKNKPEDLQTPELSLAMPVKTDEAFSVAALPVTENRKEEEQDFNYAQDASLQTGQVEKDSQYQVREEQTLTGDVHLSTGQVDDDAKTAVNDNLYKSGFPDESNATHTNIEETETPVALSIVNAEDRDDDDIINDTDNTFEKDMQPMTLNLTFDAKATTTEDTISYQPLHTSDYFASLGIKLNENGIPVDRLGKQLKSFTDWLKVMKKIHPDHLPQTDELTEQTIQEIAEKSNKKGDVVTEAMADVLIQQGKLNKAIELYQKLSLLNPSKSAYFAAKIDNIKR